MVVKLKQTSVSPALVNLGKQISTLDKLAIEKGRQALKDIEDPFMADLQFYPPVPEGSTYERTFTLRDSWYIQFKQVAGGYQIEVGNDTEYTQWVVGSLAQAEKAAAEFQQDFHAENGWPLATNTVRYWLDEQKRLWQVYLADDLSEFVEFTTKRRATTRIQRRRG